MTRRCASRLAQCDRGWIR